MTGPGARPIFLTNIALPEPGSVKYERLIDQLLMELMLASTDNVIAYRGAHRWVQGFVGVSQR